MRISDWSSDVCSSDLLGAQHVDRGRAVACHQHLVIVVRPAQLALEPQIILDDQQFARSLHAASPSAATRRRAAGSVTRKRVPSPSRLATLTSPPIAAVSWRASNAPIPNPPGLDETNGRNKTGRAHV